MDAKLIPGSTIHYRFMFPSEPEAVSALYMRVARTHLFPYYPSEGHRTFIRYVEPDEIRRRSQADHRLIVAAVATPKTPQIVGAIEIRQFRHISLLFVDDARQHIGIGRRLIYSASMVCKAHRPDLTTLSVHAAPSAITFYQKLGFVKTGPQTSQYGIISTPMTLNRIDWPTDLQQYALATH